MRDDNPSSNVVRRILARLVGQLIVIGAVLLTGVRAIWVGTVAKSEQTLYFANHTSHGDFVLLWASLPSDLRVLTRPVAAEDYWRVSKLRHFIGCDVFNALMIRRDSSCQCVNPVEQMKAALDAGDSLIMFPEGTRNTSDDIMLPLKSGLFHLARICPDVRLVPAWIQNLKRVLPKGMLVPIPIACTVCFGTPLRLAENETKTCFLERARAAMLDLRPEYDRVENSGESVV